MPPRGVKKGTKLAREYEHIKESERKSGKSPGRAKEIAARTVNKERARSGQSRTASKSSTNDISSSRRGGLRSGTARPKGRTVEQLYNEAKKLNIAGRSSMNKAQLQRAVDGKKSGGATTASSRSTARTKSTSSRTSSRTTVGRSASSRGTASRTPSASKSRSTAGRTRSTSGSAKRTTSSARRKS
jgi:hypothetical protein